MISLFIVIPGWKLLRSLGGVGLVILGVVDSSVIPTFGSLDALTAILSVKNHELWPYYAAASTLGALIGAYVTYRMSARAGEQWLEKRIGTKRSRQVQGLLKRFGFAAIFVSCVAPPPFPTSPFFIGAGALRYPQGNSCQPCLPAGPCGMQCSDFCPQRTAAPYCGSCVIREALKRMLS